MSVKILEYPFVSYFCWKIKSELEVRQVPLAHGQLWYNLVNTHLILAPCSCTTDGALIALAVSNEDTNLHRSTGFESHGAAVVNALTIQTDLLCLFVEGVL